MSVWSAGIMCYAYSEQTQDIFFLLGQDKAYANRWSDFGGAMKSGESETQCASREFVEETMAVVPITQSQQQQQQYVHPDDVRFALEQRNFTFRVSGTAAKDPEEHQRVCYVKRIPWQPDLPEKFDHVRQHLDQVLKIASQDGMEVAIAYWSTLPQSIQEHPAFSITRSENDVISSVTVKPEYTEKQQIGWWSMFRLRTILRNEGAYRNKFCFRIGFLSTLAVVVEHFSCMELLCQHLLENKRDYVMEVHRMSPVPINCVDLDPASPLTPPTDPQDHFAESDEEADGCCGVEYAEKENPVQPNPNQQAAAAHKDGRPRSDQQGGGNDA